MKLPLSIRLGFLSASNIGITFLFQWYVVASLGPGIATDALFAGMALPQLVLLVVSLSLTNVLIPLLAGEDEKSLRADAWTFLALVAMLFGCLAAGLYLLAPWWIPLLLPGFGAEGQALAIELSRIQLIGMVFTGVNGVQWASCHARQRFLRAEAMQILAGLSALLALIYCLPRYGIQAAAVLATGRVALQTLLLAPGMGWPHRPDFSRPAVRQSWQRIKPLLVGTSYYKTDPLVDRYLLSSAASGSLSLYYLAQQIYSAVAQVLSKALASPMVPLLSKLHKAGDDEAFLRTWQRRAAISCVAALSVVLGVGLLGRQGLQLLVGHGSVTAANLLELWWIMIWLGGMFVGSVLGQICASTFYAKADTRTPTRLSMWSFSVYVPCKVMAYMAFGVKGLALVTSLYYLVNMGLQFYFLKKSASDGK